MIFKIYNSDFGFKYNTQSYLFADVDSLQIEDNEMTRLTRGANASNKVGLVYKEGVKEPKRWTVTIKNLTLEMKALLDQIHAEKSRIDVFCIDRDDGSSKMAKDAVLCQQPQQLTIDETPDSMNVLLVFESFNTPETFKS